MAEHLAGRISVAITNWNGAAHVEACLRSVFAQSVLPSEVVVVDNGSTDRSPFLIRQSFPQVRLLTRPVNEGFCVGYNRAIRSCNGSYILILNSDVTLAPDFLEQSVRAIEADPAIGWVAGTVVAGHRDDHDLHGRYLKRSVTFANGDADVAGDVFAGSGAAIFCRRVMLEDIAIDEEVYDETFFAYIEDLDLAWRAQWRGWRCVYRPEIRCRHAGSASQSGRIRIRDKSIFFLTHILKNRYLTLLKNATPGIMFRFLPFFVLGEAWLWATIGLRNPAKLIAFLRAITFCASLAGPTMRKRRVVMSCRKTSDAHIIGMTRGV